MAYEWGRFIFWLGQNAAAIQALSSIANVLLTLALVQVTIRYVSLTKGILKASDAAVLSVFLPDLAGNINIHYQRRDELLINVQNPATSPFVVVRAKITGGTIYKWADPSASQHEYTAQADFKGGELPQLARLFLRKDEGGSAIFRMVPTETMEESEWLKFLDRTSLTATAIVEVCDISGRVFYSFSIMRNAHTGSTRIETHHPSVFDSR